MIRQQANKDEWIEYKAYWDSLLRKEFNDQVSMFDVHNWGGHDDNSVVSELNRLSRSTRLVCTDLTERLFILLNGDIALCCGDENAVNSIGNIFRDNPESIYNGPFFSKCRELMSQGRITDIIFCKNCSIILSRMKKEYLTVTGSDMRG